MDVAADVIATYYGGTGQELQVGGISVSALAAEYGTPLYVYSTDVMDRKWSRLREALPADFVIAYSVKANPNPAIVEHFVARGAGLEIASAGELTLALAAGCLPERIVFAGPGKTEAELGMALDVGIGEVHVESLIEARRLSQLSRVRGLVARVSIRVNPAGEVQGGAMRMGGKPSPFGVDEECLEETLNQLRDDPWLDVQGLHLFTGTQILDHTVLVRQYRKGLELARRAARHLGRPLRRLDLGGGFGVPYFPGDRELDTDRLHQMLKGLMTDVSGDPWLDGTQLMVEPGRYLTAEAGLYVARVNDIKRSRGKTFLILDGGLNHHLAASGNLGQVLKRNFPIAIANKLGEPRTDVIDVVGPLCTPLDTLARDVRLPAPVIGDLVVIFQSGAYGLTASPTDFLSHPTPAEILIDGGRAREIRVRGMHPDILWSNDSRERSTTVTDRRARP